MTARSVVRRRFTVTGRVQGVWFRESARQEADRISGLVGWIRNETDGSVVGEVQGPPERVELFLAWCRRGPPSARVDSVRAQEWPLESDEHGFRVQR